MVWAPPHPSPRDAFMKQSNPFVHVVGNERRPEPVIAWGQRPLRVPNPRIGIEIGFPRFGGFGTGVAVSGNKGDNPPANPQLGGKFRVFGPPMVRRGGLGPVRSMEIATAGRICCVAAARALSIAPTTNCLASRSPSRFRASKGPVWKLTISYTRQHRL
jgi:hypothetical protein